MICRLLLFILLAPVCYGQTDTLIVHFPDQKAVYPGGEKAMYEYLSEQLVYPEISKQNRVEGIVLLLITINKDGSTGPVSVRRGISEACDAEAIRVVKNMPLWKPAEHQGRIVASTVLVSISFRIN